MTETETPAAPASTPAAETPTSGPFLSSPPPASPAPSPSAPVPIFGGHVAEDGRFNEGWTEQLRAAGFETLAGKLQVARDEKGALKILDDTVRLASRRELKGAPNETWQDHEIAEFRRAYGIPEEVQGYKLKPDQIPAGVSLDDAVLSDFAALAHAHHIPEAAAKAVIGFHLQQAEAQAKNLQSSAGENIARLASMSEAEFAREWGSDFDTRVQANKDFVATRFSADELGDPLVQAALSHPKIVRLVDEARRSLREGTLPGVQQSSPGSMSPQQQAEQIMAAHPNWQRDSTLSKRVFELQALQSQQNKRR